MDFYARRFVEETFGVKMAISENFQFHISFEAIEANKLHTNLSVSV